MTARETPILHAIRAAVAGEPGVLVWRNNTGVDTTRGVRFGLGVGGADLVGVCECPTSIGPDHFGRFFGLEVKAPGRRPSPKQRLWADAVRRVGGFVAVVTSADEARAAIQRCKRGDAH